MPERLSPDEVAVVARLARLRLSPEELVSFSAQLGDILDHARDIAALDLEDVEPTDHPYPLVNVMRDDEPAPSLDRDEVLASAPSVEEGQFAVPPVLGDSP